jgi:hypothetical protein
MKQYFNIEKNLKKIKESRKEGELRGEKGLKEIEKLKKTWKFQKIGLSEIQNKALTNINELKSDFKAKDFLKENKELFEKYLLDEDMLKKTGKALRICERRINKINDLEKECTLESGELDHKKIFTLVFNFKPKGDVQAIIRPLGIYFKIKNEEDFARVHSGAFLTKKGLKKEDIKESKDSAGALLRKSTHRELNDAIMIESPKCFDDEDYSKETLKHEEAHIINNILLKVHLADAEFILKKLDKINTENKEDVLDIFDNAKIEARIKDEISAHFKDNPIIKNISKTLLNDFTIYDYGFDYNISKTEGNYMHSDYLEIVQKGIVAFANLLKAGFDEDTTNSLLITEPLASWEKVSERIINEKRSFQDKKNDIKKFIDKDVIKKTKDNKEYYENI